MENKKVGFTISVDILINENLNNEEKYLLLCNMEDEILNNLKCKFDCEVIGGKGEFICVDEKNNLIK